MQTSLTKCNSRRTEHILACLSYFCYCAFI